MYLLRHFFISHKFEFIFKQNSYNNYIQKNKTCQHTKRQVLINFKDFDCNIYCLKDNVAH